MTESKRADSARKYLRSYVRKLFGLPTKSTLIYMFLLHSDGKFSIYKKTVKKTLLATKGGTKLRFSMNGAVVPVCPFKSATDVCKRSFVELYFRFFRYALMVVHAVMYQSLLNKIRENQGDSL